MKLYPDFLDNTWTIAFVSQKSFPKRPEKKFINVLLQKMSA